MVWLRALIRVNIVPGLLLLGLFVLRAVLAAFPELLPFGHEIGRISLKFLIVLNVCWILDRGIRDVLAERLGIFGLSAGAQFWVRLGLRSALWFLGFMMALDALGVTLAPLLASLGVGSVAVAFALQNSLGNLFSWMYILADRPLQVGDFVRLESGAEGHIEKIGWRSTRLRLLNENLMVVPNSRVVDSALINLSDPQTKIPVFLDAGVAYRCDLELVEKVALSVTESVLLASCIPTWDTPVVRFQRFGDSSVDFRVVMTIKQPVDQGLLRHLWIKELKRAFEKADLEIPFPQRVVLHKNDFSGASSEA